MRAVGGGIFVFGRFWWGFEDEQRVNSAFFGELRYRFNEL